MVGIRSEESRNRVLVARNEKFIVLAAAPNKEGGDWLNEVTIPSALVKRIRILEVTEV